MLKNLLESFSKYTLWFLFFSAVLLLVVVFRKSLINYIKESISELKKTNWPSWSYVKEIFFVVIVVSLIFAFFTGIFDLGFTKIFEKIINL